MPVRKRIPKRREKETKNKLFPRSGHTSNNASNNNRIKHHTRQLTAAVSSLSPIFMAAPHRTPRESIAPPPSSFPRLPCTNSHGTQSSPSTPVATPPSTTQQSTAQKPLLKSHTRNKARDATSCYADTAVSSTSCQPFGRHTVQSINRTEK
ncbi:hypothetical protein TCDM_12506 [Trypanosoma cruzi Dm28c]|uniref:Uncharacterized protein n=1 Tax=Trypanosoma cruzi Dm28c TaxID=1416333 RepID=V5CLE1_TRYCR|nr:hypothetical protein TCDM_12506 [Trypanosoma cruzi Dm28c]